MKQLEVRKPHDQHLLDLFMHGSALLEPEDLGTAMYFMRLRKECEAFNIDGIWGKPNHFRLSPNGKILRPDPDHGTSKKAVFIIDEWPFL
jgi:hypothetical protein